MDAYTSFAEVYDMFMDNIPYEDWCGYLTSLLKEYVINDGLVLDLGCGTGTLTELLAKEGYDMIGVDVSEDMLQEAIEKRAESGLPILYLLQDMREFELYGTVRAVVSICDSLNYILDYDDLAHVFLLVNNYLDPKGMFIFDLNTEAKFQAMGSETIAEVRDEIANAVEAELDKIAEDNNVTIHYELYSGQNDQTTLKQIGDQAVADGVDAIIPIATLPPLLSLFLPAPCSVPRFLLIKR